jgi:hypothetical protein
MKYSLLTIFLLSEMLIAVSLVNATTRPDVGVIGPNAEVRLYYKEDDLIFIKKCEPNTILGNTPEEARIKCEGKSIGLSIKIFKQELRKLVSTINKNNLKPLTAEEVIAYNDYKSNLNQIDAMVKELNEIEKFNQAYGSENGKIERKKFIEREIENQKTLISASKKVEEEVERVVNLIENQPQLTITMFNSEKSQFLYTVLKEFNLDQKFPCGLKGSVEERIESCSTHYNSKKENFVLVARTENFKEVYKELSLKLLWSDRLPNKMNHLLAETACNSSLEEVAGITDVTWELPSIDQYENSVEGGIRRVLPDMVHWFWSSTRYYREHDMAWLFNGHHGGSEYYHRNLIGSDYSVRCVADVN